MVRVLKLEKHFNDIIRLIEDSKTKALMAVNHELVDLYWNIGKYISTKIKNAEWGESVVKELAEFILKKYQNLKGYSDKNLWRMKQFYDKYNNQKLSPLVRQLTWTNNIIILSKCKTSEEREFYIRLCIKEKYSKRELERQIDSGFYERTMISKKVSPVVTQFQKKKMSAVPKEIKDAFRDTYILDFLNLPKGHSEKDLRYGLITSFKEFVLEFGKDFSFVGEEYRISVGNKDFYIDLLFYHRGLRCLVAFELKIDDFKPEYLGKLNFYLEALDRDVKKSHENPSVGIILCKSRDNEVVEYALNRNISPALISEYKTKLIPKEVLQRKLHEMFEERIG